MQFPMFEALVRGYLELGRRIPDRSGEEAIWPSPAS